MISKNVNLVSISGLPPFEQQLILAHILGLSREYVLSHPEIKLTKIQENKLADLIKRRQNHEPMAYILGHKEFYGLDFKVTPDTLIPRPETELLVELGLIELRNILRNSASTRNITLIDVGTGSGNIIISLASSLKNILPIKNHTLMGVDISSKALRVARYNAKNNSVDKKIKFIKSDLLEYFLKNNLAIKQLSNLIIVANLPYLSKTIYSSSMPDVKNFEPKSALYSAKEGLLHYKKLFCQIRSISAANGKLKITTFIEISPEQKIKIDKMIKKILPRAKANFQKDLAGKWRLVGIHF
jgi:release factor glutamine methyltransferase